MTISRGKMATLRSSHFSSLPFDPSLGSDRYKGSCVSESVLQWFSSVIPVRIVPHTTWELTENAKSWGPSQTYRMKNCWGVCGQQCVVIVAYTKV